MKAKLIPSVAILSGLMLGIPALAPAQMAWQIELMFNRLDRNQDQRVDQDEYLAGKRQRMPDFSLIDLNGDAALSLDEFRNIRQIMRRKHQGSGGGKQRGMAPQFSDFDRNQDGSIDEAEFIEARGQRIQQRAKQGMPMKGLGNIMEFSDIDDDGNGRITRDEFAAALQEHRHKQHPNLDSQ